MRPEVYHEINNFYTATVYQKGAEVVRMLKRLIGAHAFRASMDLYFERYGTAATVEDFIVSRRFGTRSLAIHALVRAGRHAESDGSAPGVAGRRPTGSTSPDRLRDRATASCR